MDTVDKEGVQQHDIIEQEQDYTDGGWVQWVEGAVWWQAFEGIGFEDDSETAGFTVAERRVAEEGLALTQVLQTVTDQQGK